MGGNAMVLSALKAAFRMVGKEFVLGENMREAVRNSKTLKKNGYLVSYDMLGEGARTTKQAEAYLKAYLSAIEECDSFSRIFENDSISVKISALHPKYELLKYEQLRTELLPRLKQIILSAKSKNIAVIIDAEEARRLDLSLLIFSELFMDDEVRYHGLGLAVQAYHKRALYVLEYLQKLAAQVNVKIPVRLVKGAYWDSEIKKYQAEGTEDYPVFTAKENTDLNYLACAKFMINNAANFYPQFATHNLVSICAIAEMTNGIDYEFQRLQGMGEDIYNELGLKCRVYAPVGEHADLLAYLIRRLLENGANNSFVNQFSSKTADELIKLPQPQEARLKLPAQVFNNRKNSKGFDIGNWQHLELLQSDKALKLEAASQSKPILKFADLMEENYLELVKILREEGRKTLQDAINEVREAVDFCRYYSLQAEHIMQPRKMAGITGEENIYQLEPRGKFVCISPWNFPLAIFTGQIVAALATGNKVVAKPAAQTPRIAQKAVELMHKAGVPKDMLELKIGEGSSVGKALVSAPDIAGVVFTGSNDTAKKIAKSILENNPALIPFIAETGGQNCMIVDSTALIEHAVDDVVLSAFGSAGQRCSALRVVYVQEDIADKFIDVLTGAMKELEVSKALSADVGEVIDAGAKESLNEHISEMKREAKLLYACTAQGEGNYIPPHLFEIKSISQLHKENFGPVLHLIRYKAAHIDDVIVEVNSTGYGLTFGIQTRIKSRAEYIASRVRSGNIYVNRSMIGAVVESQPFGGMGLSGTGFKAGGEEYLKRFCSEKVITTNTTAIGGNLDLI
jgi:RHH-type proline utilization regulon transcriptional repressor/proline dehydrogenase/delta 1-pyrroline-5-carboxylate dehydrogenase